PPPQWGPSRRGARTAPRGWKRRRSPSGRNGAPLEEGLAQGVACGVEPDRTAAMGPLSKRGSHPPTSDHPHPAPARRNGAPLEEGLAPATNLVVEGSVSAAMGPLSKRGSHGGSMALELTRGDL